MAHKILIVDDDPAQRRILEELVKRYGFETVTADGASQGLDILEASRSKPVDLIILDLVMPEIDGLEFLERLSAYRTSVPVIVQTAQGSIETVVKAMRAGADDFVVKPVNPERLKVSIQNLLKVNALTEEVKRLNQKVSGEMSFDDLIIASPAMSSVVKLGKRAAHSNIPVLIEGESGSGKEMIARAIQGESERRGKAFVAVN
ncbi:MAG: response regulator, partial [Pseudomonadota bacterium]